MKGIIPIKGKVDFQITLDPGVWIFDDRKLEIESLFDHLRSGEDEREQYTRSISSHWDREIMEGAVYPPTLKSEKKFEKQKILHGSFAIPLKPFLKNAGVHPDAESLVIEQESGTVELPLETAEEAYLAFSENGKPLLEDGPVHIYLGDGSNRDHPIKHVRQFILK